VRLSPGQRACKPPRGAATRRDSAGNTHLCHAGDHVRDVRQNGAHRSLLLGVAEPHVQPQLRAVIHERHIHRHVLEAPRQRAARAGHRDHARLARHRDCAPQSPLSQNGGGAKQGGLGWRRSRCSDSKPAERGESGERRSPPFSFGPARSRNIVLRMVFILALRHTPRGVSEQRRRGRAQAAWETAQRENGHSSHAAPLDPGLPLGGWACAGGTHAGGDSSGVADLVLLTAREPAPQAARRPTDR